MPPAFQPVATNGGEPRGFDDPTEAWLSKEQTAARRAQLGLADPRTVGFMNVCEFVSLGCFCAVPRALQALGVKKHTYPLDWTRSPVEGVIHLLDTDFEDFLTFTKHVDGTDAEVQVVYAQARWGGSFWHHDPDKPKARDDFVRRIERMLGLRPEVPVSVARVFVRSANSTRELDSTLKLYAALQRMLPTTRVYLLVVIDLQEAEEAIAFQDEHAFKDVLVYRLPEKLFRDTNNYANFSFEACATNYARALSVAIRVWAGAAHPSSVKRVPDVVALGAACDQMDGGHPGTETYWPRRFQGQQLSIRRPPVISKLLPPQLDVPVPPGTRPHQMITVQAFGHRDIRVQVPATWTPPHQVRLRLVEGAIRVSVAPAEAAAASGHGVQVPDPQRAGSVGMPPMQATQAAAAYTSQATQAAQAAIQAALQAKQAVQASQATAAYTSQATQVAPAATPSRPKSMAPAQFSPDPLSRSRQAGPMRTDSLSRSVPGYGRGGPRQMSPRLHR